MDAFLLLSQRRRLDLDLDVMIRKVRYGMRVILGPKVCTEEVRWRSFDCVLTLLFS